MIPELNLLQIDIFLKTKKPPYSISKTAELLHITSWETADYLVKALNRNGFKTILTAPDILDTPLQKRVQRVLSAAESTGS